MAALVRPLLLGSLLLSACTFEPPSATRVPAAGPPTTPTGVVQTDGSGRRHVGRVAVVPVSSGAVR